MIVDAWGATTLFDLVFFFLGGDAPCYVRGLRGIVGAWGATTLFDWFFFVQRRRSRIWVEPSTTRRK